MDNVISWIGELISRGRKSTSSVVTLPRLKPASLEARLEEHKYDIEVPKRAGESGEFYVGVSQLINFIDSVYDGQYKGEGANINVVLDNKRGSRSGRIPFPSVL